MTRLKRGPVSALSPNVNTAYHAVARTWMHLLWPAAATNVRSEGASGSKSPLWALRNKRGYDNAFACYSKPAGLISNSFSDLKSSTDHIASLTLKTC